MRIICPKCAVAYSIEDRLLHGGGVRAQCPRCQHLHRVSTTKGLSTNGTEWVDSGFLDNSGAPRPEVFRPGTAALSHEPVPQPFAVESDVRIPRRNFRLLFVVIPLFGLLLGGLTALLFIYEPWAPTAPPLVAETLATPVDEALKEWTLNFPNLVGNVEELVASGNQKLLLDRTSSYREAEMDFQRAFILSPTSEAAVVGYVHAVALGRSQSLDEKTYRIALGLIRWAEERGGAQPTELVAHAHLLLTRTGAAHLTNARALAERAILTGDAKTKSAAYLALGRTYLDANPIRASEHIQKAVELDPGSRQSYLYKARVARSRGEVREAVESLEGRLGLDEDQWEVSLQLVRAYIEVGELTQARSLLERIAASPSAGSSRHAALTLGVMLYQHERQYGPALAVFEKLLQRIPDSETFLKADVLSHLATVQRLLGRTDAAAKAANDALLLHPASNNARLQMFLIELSRGAVGLARGHFVLLSGKLQDSALESLLEGLLFLTEKKWRDAQKLFEKAVQLQPGRIDALFLAAAAAAHQRDDKAATYWLFERATRADPLRRAPVSVLSEAFVETREWVAREAAVFTSLKKGPLDPNPALAQALVAYHTEDFASSKRLVGQVLALDPANGMAMALRALLAVKRMDVGNAEKYGQDARMAGSLSSLNHFAYAETQRLLKNWFAAKEGYQKALQLDATFLGASLRLGEMEGKLGRREEAVKIILPVIRLDPTFLDAYRALYTLPR